MDDVFNEALRIAKNEYPHPINKYEEYAEYYVFEYDDGEIHDGGTMSPIVVRKSDMKTLNYAPIFFNMSEDAPDVGEIISEGTV